MRGSFSQSLSCLQLALISLDKTMARVTTSNTTLNTTSNTTLNTTSNTTSTSVAMIRLEKILSLIFDNYYRCTSKNVRHCSLECSSSDNNLTFDDLLSWIFSLKNILLALGSDKLTSLFSELITGTLL